MRLMLAPMEGVIDHTMRGLLSELGGLDRCVTEFVRVSDLLLPPRVFHRYCPELRQGGTTASGVPVYLQLLGGDPSPMAENAARAAELGAPGIDLNFGCPAKTVNRSEGGAILLREPERVHAIVAAVRQAVPVATPVTVKIRLGYRDRDLLEDNARGIAAAGADELAVHARTKIDAYRPPAYWEEIARVREWVDLPVIANGEIWSPQEALRCQQVSGCEDLMLGRGLICRPDLARLIQAEKAGESIAPLSWTEVQDLVLRLFDLTLEHYQERYVGNPIKQWLAYQRYYYPQAALLFERIKRLREAADIRAQLLASAPSLADRPAVA
ncbi:MAG: tRNA-dihydrouridine synthase [Halieaceae bacterium]